MNRATLLKTLVKVGISIAILVVLVTNLKSHRLLETLQTITPWQLALALVGYLFCQVISTIKWLQLAHSMRLGGRFLQFYQYYLMGMFFGLFLPTAIGGDVGRALLLAKDKSSRWTQAFLSIVGERLSGIIGLLIYVIISLYIIQPGQYSGITFLFLTALTLFALVFAFGFRKIEHHPWGHWFIQKFVLKQQAEGSDPGEIWPRPKAFIVAIVLSLLFHACSIILQIIMLALLGAHVSFMLMAIVYGLAGIASMIPISFSGIGLREGSMTFLLINWGHITPEAATAFSLIWLSIILLAAVPGGLLTLKQQVFMPARKKI